MFGVFEASVASEQEVGLAKQASADKFAAAVYDVREKLGPTLFASSSIEEFRHKVAMMKHDQSLYRVIEASGMFPNVGTVRRIVGRGGELEREFKQILAKGQHESDDEWLSSGGRATGELLHGPAGGDVTVMQKGPGEPDPAEHHRPEHEYSGPPRPLDEDFLPAEFETFGPAHLRAREWYRAHPDAWPGDMPGTHEAARYAQGPDPLSVNGPIGSDRSGGPAPAGDPNTSVSPTIPTTSLASRRYADGVGSGLGGEPNKPGWGMGAPTGGGFGTAGGAAGTKLPATSGTAGQAQNNLGAGANPIPGGAGQAQNNFGAGAATKALEGTFGTSTPIPTASGAGAPQSPMTGTWGKTSADKDPSRPIQKLEETFQPSDKLLKPKNDWEGYKNRVDQGGPAKVKKLFANLDFSLYTDWCQAKGLSAARLSSLDAYASHLSDEQYLRLAATLQACNSTGEDWEGSHHPKTPSGQGKTKLKDVTAAGRWYPTKDEVRHNLISTGRCPTCGGKHERGESHDPPWDHYDDEDDGEDEVRFYSGPFRTLGHHRTAAPDYLRKADDALTQLLQQKQQEFQESLAPLQQALITVQQAEQIAQAQNPLNVLPPQGTVNVLPGGDQGQAGMPAPGAPNLGGAAEALAGQADPLGLGGGGGMPGGDMSGGGTPDGGMGPNPAGEGGPPPAAGPAGLPSPDQQKAARRKASAKKGEARSAGSRRQAVSVAQLWAKWVNDPNSTQRGGAADYAAFAQQYGIGQRALQKLKAQHGVTAGRHNKPPTHQVPMDDAEYDSYLDEEKYSGGTHENYAGPHDETGIGDKKTSRWHLPSAPPLQFTDPKHSPLRPRYAPWDDEHEGEGKEPLGELPDKYSSHREACWPGCHEHPEHVRKYHKKKTDKESMRKGAPFAGYTDFADCVSQHQDANDPDAYCGKIKHQVEDGKKKKSRRRTAEEYSGSGDVEDESGPFAGPHGSFPVGTEKDKNDAKAVCNMPSVKSKHPGTCEKVERMGSAGWQPHPSGGFRTPEGQFPYGMVSPGRKGWPSEGQWVAHVLTGDREHDADPTNCQVGVFGSPEEAMHATEAAMGHHRMGSRKVAQLYSDEAVAEAKRNPKLAWSGWGPAVFPKTRKVAGWDWDDHLNGYLANAPRQFLCACGSEFPTPSGFHRCACGKQYNSYVIGTGGSAREAAAEKFIVREVPVRHDVIVASKNPVAPMSDDEYERYLYQRGYPKDQKPYWDRRQAAEGGGNPYYNPAARVDPAKMWNNFNELGVHNEDPRQKVKPTKGVSTQSKGGPKPDPTKVTRTTDHPADAAKYMGPQHWAAADDVHSWHDYKQFLDDDYLSYPQGLITQLENEDRASGVDHHHVDVDTDDLDEPRHHNPKPYPRIDRATGKPAEPGSRWATVTLMDPRTGKRYEMIDPYADGEEDDWPSDHHPETDHIKSTPNDWYRRDQNQRWVKSSGVDSDLSQSVHDEGQAQRDYTDFAADAEAAGKPEVADRYREVRRDETQHEKEFRALQGGRRAR